MHKILVKRNAEIPDTISLIIDRINMDWIRPFTAALCSELNSDDPDRLAFLQRLQAYVNRNVQPKLDVPPDEDVFCPETTINRGIGDCKKMTVIIGSALRKANIPFFLKHVYYADRDFTHIYIVVPYPCAKGYVTLDAMENNQFDNEVSHARSNVYDLNGTKMNLYTGNRGSNMHSGKYSFMSAASMGSGNILQDISMINGCACGSPEETAILSEIFSMEPQSLSGRMGKRTKEERKEDRKKLFDKFKDVGLTIPRASFLLLVHANALKLGTRLLKAWKKDKGRLESFWSNLGGDQVKLKQAIEHGAGQRMSGMGFAVPAALAAAAATATPVIIKAVDFLKQLGITEGDEADKELDDGLEDAEKEAVKPTFVVPKTAVPATVPQSKPSNQSTPSAGSFGPMEINSWFDVAACFIKSGIYNMALQFQFGIVAATIITSSASLYVCRKFLAQKTKSLFSFISNN